MIISLRPILIFVAFLFVTTLPIPGLAQKAKTDDAWNWRQHMTALSQTLVDAFPFFYSPREFADQKNEKNILRHLNTLASITHLMPTESGARLIGSEPLIESAQLDMQADFTEAIDLYKKGKKKAAQKQIHSSIQRCFACHTAYQVGPTFPTTNQEVMGMPTPFLLGKAVVFGALRQFDGALNLAETVGSNSKDAVMDDMSKLYFVISLRVKQDFQGSLDFLDKLMNKNPEQPALVSWKSDIQAWRSLAAEKDADMKLDAYVSDQLKTGVGRNEESLFVVYLMDSMTQHRKLSEATILPADKAATYLRLARVYEGLYFTPLEDLPEIYRKACIAADPHGPTAHACSVSGRP